MPWAPAWNLHAAIPSGPSPTLNAYSPRCAVLCCAAQNWDDEDIPLLLEWVDEQLAEGILQLSSFERYKKELLAGTLNWSPLHDQVGLGRAALLRV